jgi:hypothetical protein
MILNAWIAQYIISMVEITSNIPVNKDRIPPTNRLVSGPKTGLDRENDSRYY